MTNMTGSKLSIFSHPGKITGYWISISRPILARPNMGLDFVSNLHDVLLCIPHLITHDECSIIGA
jgi:hypothetical protein